MPDPHRAEGPRGVVDQVGQRLRHRRPRDRAEEVVQLDRGPAGVERAAHGAGREAVDRRPAARLHVGDQLQPAGQLRLQRPGRDRGQVGLEQHVVDRLGQQPGQGLRAPSRRRRPAGRGRTTPGRPARSPRATAASVTVHSTWSARVRGRRGRCQRSSATTDGTPVPGGQAARRRAAPPARPASSRRVSTMCTPASSGASAFQVLPGGVAGADQPGHPRAVQPGPGQPGPALGRRPQHPGVDQVGRQPDRVAGAVGARSRRSPAAEAISTSRATVGSSTCSAGRGRLEVADAEPAAAQRRRRLRRPTGRAAARGGAPPRTPRPPRPRRPGPRRARWWPAAGTSSTGSVVVCPPRSAIPTSPGTTTVPVPRGTSSRRDSSSSAGRGRRPRAARCAGRRRWSPRRRRPATCSSIARAGADSSASRAATSAAVGVGAEQRPQPAHARPPGRRSSPSATPLSGRSPPVDSQASARSTSRSSAGRDGRRVGVDDAGERLGLTFDLRRPGHLERRARAG